MSDEKPNVLLSKYLSVCELVAVLNVEDANRYYCGTPYTSTNIKINTNRPSSIQRLISIFDSLCISACPIGYFGNGCTSRCNCKNEQRCTCANCTCSSGCKSGWMGSRCEFRSRF